MEIKTLIYNNGYDKEKRFVMPKKIQTLLKEGEECFGDRLNRLRKASGYSLRELASEVGVSHRMLVYYEKHSEHPPAHLLPQLAKVLGITADQLLGIERVKTNGRAKDTKLWRRFSQLEKLPPAERKPIIHVLDAFLEREKLKKTG